MMNEWILSSSALILAVIMIRFALKGKISLRLQYALWALVLARLLIPFQLFTSTLSVSGAARELEVDLSQPVRQVYTAVQAPQYQAEYNAIYEQILQSEQPEAPDTAAVERQTLERVEEKQEADVTLLLYRLWLAGAGVMALVLLGCNVHFALRLRRSREVVEDALCLLAVYVTPVVPTPCIFGLFQPAVYLTPEVAEDPKARGHVLAHEMTHYRHLDHIWSVLRNVCLILHWYNPLVWVSFRLSREDAELACDEGALLTLGEEQRGEYGRTLIRLSCGGGLTTGLIAATTMTGSARSIARRLKTIMKRRRTTLLALIAVVLAGAVAIGCTFSGAPETTGSDSRSLTTEDGVIVYPGTAWGMTQEEVKAALGLEEADCTIETNDSSATLEAKNQTLFGVPATVMFVFRSFSPNQKLELEIVHVEFETEEDYDTVYPELVAQLGEPDGALIQTLHKETDADDGHSAGSIQTWKSDRKVSDYATAEQWQLYLEKYGSVSEDAAASTLTAYGAWDGQLPYISFHSNMLELLGAIDSGALALTPEERILRSCMALFEKDGAVDWYRAATTSVYDDPTQIHLGELFCDQLTDRADLTDAELAVLWEQYPQDAVDSAAVLRVTVPEMRAVMEEYFGVSLDDCDLGTMEDYLYCAQTEAYLELTTVPNAYDPEFSGGAVLENGDVVLYYTNRYYTKHYSDKLCAITLRQKGDVWQIRSNRLVDPPAQEPTSSGELSLITEGVIVYPGTSWNMTPEEVKAALGLQAEDCETYVDEKLSDDYWVYAFGAVDQTFFGAPVTLRFEFRAYTSERTLELCLVDVILENEEDLYDVYGLLMERLGESSYMTSGVMSAVWDSEPTLADFGDRDFWGRKKEYAYGSDPASSVYLYGPGTGQEPCVMFSSNLAMLQLERQGQTPTPDMSDQSQQIPIPDFTEPQEGTELTSTQIDQINAAFEPLIPGEGTAGELEINPICCFFTSYYTDVRELDLREFLRYCPVAEPATEEEYKLLQKLEEFPYTGDFSQMPVPLHRYRWEDVDALLTEYTGLGLDDRYEREEFPSELYFLPKTNCFYNTTSDFGLGTFPCIGGMIYPDHVELYSKSAVLILREEKGKYYIQSHMSLIESSAPEERVAATVTAFLRAYEENVYLCTDNGYDHLTVLAADPERTVEYQGNTVPLSAFYGNIEYLDGKAAYWKHVRQDQGIVRDSFQVTPRVTDIRYDGNAAVVQVEAGITFTYSDAAAPSGLGEEFEILLVNLDDSWLVADVTQHNDWFDAEHKNDPNFDPEKEIAAYL